MDELLEKLQDAEEIAFYESIRNEEQKEILKAWDNSLRLLIKDIVSFRKSLEI